MTYREFLRHIRAGIEVLPGLSKGALYVPYECINSPVGYCAVGAGLRHAGFDAALLGGRIGLYLSDEAEGIALPDAYEEDVEAIMDENDAFVGTPADRRAYMLRYVDGLLDEEARKAEHEGEPLVTAPPTLESLPVDALV